MARRLPSNPDFPRCVTLKHLRLARADSLPTTADLATLSTDTADLLVHSAAASEVEAQAAGGEKEATTGTAGEVPEEEDPLATLNEEQVKVQTLVRIPVDDEGASVATDPQVGDAATASAQT